ncbi:MAG: helix-turn-helix transcriptional regulator [Desulforhopalus sp.]
MKSDFSIRLQRLIDIKKISQVDVAEGVGVSEPMVTNWLNGKTKSPRRTTLQKLVDFFGCNIEWLADGTGEIFPQKEQSGGEKKLIINGNSNIQAGGQISGQATISPRESSPVILDEDELQLILMLRDTGGKRMLRKFKNELIQLQKIIDEK